MIDKDLLTATVNEAIEGTPLFLVDIDVRPGNTIVVEVDSTEGVDIDQCVAITRKIEERFDRDVEDYELEVGSAGLTSPFKVRAQYIKNIGNPVEVLTRDGRKIKGTLTSVSDTDSSFVITIKTKVKEPGKKKPVEVEEPITLTPDECKYVKYLIEFK
ncbi:ribosome assembly cofactor RimP [Muribaculum intestinale]|uniref:ribosome assembly cofactor RimP n=1 Tax=Muribaculum intestinale TaxID=1796646 RepID=UPI001433EA91|nr:ribosome assembly cofactor RimP [Muribaculum intestinale]GFI67679.1 ribosome maturation factor RimP [Muribaculaceae bacterium]